MPTSHPAAFTAPRAKIIRFSALCEIGDIDSARRMLEKLLSYASPLLLYAEEIDPGTGRHLGNFPQAFTHLALINAVLHVIAHERSTESGDDTLRRRPT